MMRDRTSWLALAGLAAGFVVLFLWDYPPISAVEDETGFLNQALVWSRGSVSAEGAGYEHGLTDFIAVNGRHVPSRHPGRSVAAWPFLAVGGARATFVSGLLLHLATTLAGALTLERLGRSPLWAVLILCHPTLALFSRTIMADESAGLGVLLAALGVLAGSPVGAGLAVGLAAAMRYHSALFLPVVALAFLVPREGRGPRPWRDAAVCLAAGGAVGLVLVGYNVAVYGTPGEPFTARRGYFSSAMVGPNAAFYVMALMAVWPGMLLAIGLDRSRIRWLSRGAAVVFLGPLLFYYFHDVAGRLESLVVGQRLIQVALPLWVVSYAGVLDDLVARPLRKRLGGRVWGLVVTAGCLGLLAGVGVMFDRHQRYLTPLRRARDAFVAHVPAGSLVVYQGALVKLVGTPADVPEYRFRIFEFEGKPAEDPAVLFRDLDRAPRPWFLGVLHKTAGERGTPTDYGRGLVERYGLEPVDVGSPWISLYVAREGAKR